MIARIFSLSWPLNLSIQRKGFAQYWVTHFKTELPYMNLSIFLIQSHGLISFFLILYFFPQVIAKFVENHKIQVRRILRGCELLEKKKNTSVCVSFSLKIIQSHKWKFWGERLKKKLMRICFQWRLMRVSSLF